MFLLSPIISFKMVVHKNISDHTFSPKVHFVKSKFPFSDADIDSNSGDMFVSSEAGHSCAGPWLHFKLHSAAPGAVRSGLTFHIELLHFILHVV